MTNNPRQSTTAIDTTMPRSNSKLAPPSETVVDEDNCCQSQLIAESAVLPKADATLLNTEDVFSSVASAFGNTADSAINWLWQQLSSSTTVSLGGANFELDLGIVVSIAVVLCLGLFVIQMAVCALRRDAGGVGRALRGLVIATIGCAITLASLNVLLLGVDQLCVGIVRVATGGTIATLGTKIIGGAMFTTA